MALSERARQVMAATRTDPAAAYFMAGWYRGGEEGLHQSQGLAFRWELRVAEGGQSWVGWAYHAGVGVSVDYEASTTWYGKAAARGDRAAPFNLGSALVAASRSDIAARRASSSTGGARLPTVCKYQSKGWYSRLVLRY